MIQSNKNIW